MNAVSLYISVSRIAFQYNSLTVDQKWGDLYRLVPFLRQSLSCAVCGRLLIDPYSTKDGKCQHFVCRLCVRGRKNIKPSCTGCVQYQDFKLYEENRQVQVLLQSYKSICAYIMTTTLYKCICAEKVPTGVISNGIVIPNLSLVELIEEGANFEDVHTKKHRPVQQQSQQSQSQPQPQPQPPLQLITQIKKEPHQFLTSQPPPLTLVNKSSLCLNSGSSSNNQIPHTIQINPVVSMQQKCTMPVAAPPLAVVSTPIDTKSVKTIITNAVPQISPNQIRKPPPFKTVSNGSAMYSVMYTGIGNKITIKRKTDGYEENMPRKTTLPTLVREIVKPNVKRRGCRCGNATPTPGKLTCCGQRCPCYVDAKPCIDCKCRGCRNPHRSDGEKVIPVLPELACYEIQMLDEGSNFNTTLVNKAKKPNVAISSCSPTVTAAASSTTVVPSLASTSLARTVFNPAGSHPIIEDINKTKISSGHPMAISSVPAKTSQIISFATNQMQTDCSTSIMKLQDLPTESLYIQSAEGKVQVYNVYTSNAQSIQRFHQISTVSANSNNSNTILLQAPSSNSHNVHQIPDISTTLPQIIMQPSRSSPATQPAPNIITVHPLPTNHPQHHPPHLNPSAPTSITLSPIIVNSPSTFSEIFADDEYIASPQHNQSQMSSLATTTTISMEKSL